MTGHEEVAVEEIEVEGVRPAQQEALGLFAYSALAAMTRLAKDGDQAPNTDFHIQLAQLANRGFRSFEELERIADEQGFSLTEAAGIYSGLFDELDARTRPTNWWERIVKSYVVLGIFADVLHQLGERHQLVEANQVSWDLGHGKWVRETLEPVTRDDPQLAARLSLWARRVAGEAFGLLRATLFTYPDLAIDPDTVDAVVAFTAQRHAERMEAVNLTA